MFCCRLSIYCCFPHSTDSRMEISVCVFCKSGPHFTVVPGKNNPAPKRQRNGKEIKIGAKYFLIFARFLFAF